MSVGSEEIITSIWLWHEHVDAVIMQAEIEVPIVEALIACPLSKNINFVANDCGY